MSRCASCRTVDESVSCPTVALTANLQKDSGHVFNYQLGKIFDLDLLGMRKMALSANLQKTAEMLVLWRGEHYAIPCPAMDDQHHSYAPK